jgi:hypothetical protein
VFAQNNLPTCKGPVFSWSDCEGTEIFPGGDKYIGQFKSGRFSGRGIYYFLAPNQSEGNFFVGEFKDGMYNGLGIEYDKNGVVLNSGKWKNSQIEDQFAINPSLFGTLAEALPFYKVQQQLLLGTQQKERLTQDINGGSNSNKSQTSAASMWLPVFNLPRCEGSDMSNWNGCIGITFQQGKPYSGQFRNGSPYGQFEVLNNSQTQMAEVSTLPQQQITEFNTQEKQRLENEKLRVEATLAIQRQQELEEQLRQAQESRKKEQDRILADQKANEQKRLFEESQIKEQQRLAIEASEISRLRAEAEEAKRKQTELEEQLRQTQQGSSITTQTASIGIVGRRIALVVGNANYKVRPLKNPRNDADDVSRSLKATGFEVIDLRDATLPQMRTAVRLFGDRLINNDVGLVYYSGHGVEVKGRNYFIPVNADIQREDEIADQGLDVSLILEKMSTAGKGVNILIVDACRDDPFGRSFRSSSRGLANMDAPRGTIIAYATSPGKVASDGDPRERNSPYTKHLVKAMQSPNKPIEQVFKEVRRAVQDETKNQQTPWENTSLSGDFFFSIKK